MTVSIVSMQSAVGFQPPQATSLIARATNSSSEIPQTQAQTQAPNAIAKVKAAEAEKPSAGKVQQSLDDINKAMIGFSISVQFQIDPDYKDLIVKVVDQDTGKLIRQIPTEEAVKMSKSMDSLKGLLFSQSA